jgi:hypothetical protein
MIVSEASPRFFYRILPNGPVSHPAKRSRLVLGDSGVRTSSSVALRASKKLLARMSHDWASDDTKKRILKAGNAAARSRPWSTTCTIET